MAYTLNFNQFLKDGTITRSHLDFESLVEAKSRYHLELAQVGISPVIREVRAEIQNDIFEILAVDDLHIEEEDAEPESVEPVEEEVIPE